MTENAIEVRELSKRFVMNPNRRASLKERVIKGSAKHDKQDFWALRDVSFTVPRGVTLGLVGSNGAGKSTALKVLAGIYRPTSGSVQVNGRMSALLELGAGFHGELTGRENIDLNAAILGLSPKEIAAVTDKIVEFAEIGEFIDAPVKVYSSGMFVRLGFAVAVNVQPDVLVVDEVIAVGDERFQRKCFDHLFEMRRRGATIVVVSHALGLLEDICDELVWLDGGRVKSYGEARGVVREYLADVNAIEAQERDSTDELNDSDRHGTGEIRVHDVTWSIDEGPFQRAAVVAGQRVTFRIEYEAVSDLDNAVFGLGFVNEAGISVAGPNSGASRTWSVQKGRGFVYFTVDKLLLQPAEFGISAAIVDKAHVFDYLDRAYQFRVQIQRQRRTRLGPHARDMGSGFGRRKDAAVIFDEETGQTILFALASGYLDRAGSLAFDEAHVPEAERERLAALFVNAGSVSEAARAFGDWLRASGGDRWMVNQSYRICFYRGDWWREQAQSPMTRYFFGNKAGRPLDKWPHYFPIYERYLSRFVGSDVRVLEIGVFRGGGIDLLSDFLGPAAHLVGFDIDPTARDLTDPRFPVVIGDQSEPADLIRVHEELGPFDVIIDDGGHTVNQQITSAEVLFPLLKDDGVYLIEDVHTSYWRDYLDAGDLTLLDWTRQRLDDLNAYHFSEQEQLTMWQLHLRAVHMYDSVVVMEKGVSYPPFSELVGTKEFALPTRERESVDLELLATRDAALVQRDRARTESEALRADLERATQQLAELRASRSWRLTSPFRRGLGSPAK